MKKNTITPQKLEKYFSVTEKALDMAKDAFDTQREEIAADFFDMAQRYVNDAHFFVDDKNDMVLAFAALNYAHGWLDAGARIGVFQVSDSTLFTVDGEE